MRCTAADNYTLFVYRVLIKLNINTQKPINSKKSIRDYNCSIICLYVYDLKY